MKKTTLSSVIIIMILVLCAALYRPLLTCLTAYAHAEQIPQATLHTFNSSDGEVQIRMLLDPIEETVCYFPNTNYANTPTCFHTQNTRFSRQPTFRGPVETGSGTNIFQVYIFVDFDRNNVCYIPNTRGANTPFCINRIRR